MDAQLVQLADAVVTALNGRTFSRSFLARRAYVPSVGPGAVGLTVLVVPRGVEIEPLHREAVQVTAKIDVGVIQTVAPERMEEIDPLLGLVEEIGDFLKFRELEGFPTAQWVGLAHQPVYVPEKLEKHRQFFSVLTLSYVWSR